MTDTFTCVNERDCFAYPGYPDGEACISCSDTNCASCEYGETTCDQCKSNFFLKDNECFLKNECEQMRGYADVNGRCEDCNVACATCYGASNEECYECHSDYVFLDGMGCIGECPTNMYENDGLCVNCDSSCGTCDGDGSQACTSCASDKFFAPFTKECVNSCREGTFEDEANCQPCHEACKSCFASGPSACLTCNEGDLLWSANNECIDVCPDDTFLTGNFSCENCDVSCATCFSGEADACTSCNPSSSFTILHDSMCLDECPDGTYEDDNQVCQPCFSTCDTCTGGLADQCLTCPENGTFLIDGVCVDGCGVGSYSVGDVCYDCDSQCFTCEHSGMLSALYTEHYCTACREDAFLRSSGTCNENCEDGWFPDVNRRICDLCDPLCNTCDGAGPSACTSCSTAPDGSHLLLDGSSCVSECRVGFYDLEGVCTPCDSEAAGCASCIKSSDQCLSCVESRFAYGSTCQETCPDGTYGMDSTCVPCNTSCHTCSSGGPNACLTCNGDDLLLVANNSCVRSCPDGTYDDDEGKCQNCDSSCASCSGAGSKACESCTGELLFVQDTNECHQECPGGYYEGLFNLCYTCNDTCSTCANADTCTGCKDGTFLFEGECADTCPQNRAKSPTWPDGYRPSTYSDEGICQPCDISCQTCNAGDDQSCTRCPLENEYAFLNPDLSCRASCPDGYFGHQHVDFENEINLSTCELCDSTCGTCHGGLATDCTSCPSEENTLFEPLTGSCVTECSPDRYESVADRRCVGSCPLGTYDDGDRKCRNCDPSCESCTGAGPQACSACTSELLFVQDSNECLQECRGGYFGNGGLCWACSSTCATCVDATTCTGCKDGTFLFEGECTETCPQNRAISPTWPDGIMPSTYPAEGGICKPCDISCQTCSAGDVNSCTSCPLETNYAFLNHDSSCRASCPDGYFGHQYVEQGINLFTCELCDSTCGTCTGSEATECTSCPPEASTLFEPVPDTLTGSCVTECSPGRYDDGQGACGICSDSCLTCSGSSTSCDSCPNGMFLYRDECRSSCPSTYYEDSEKGSCEACGSNCNACDNQDNCLSCQPSFSLYNGICMSECPAGYFSGRPPNVHVGPTICRQCDSSCADCDSQGPTSCTACPDGTYLDEGTCQHCNEHCSTCSDFFLCDTCSDSMPIFVEGECLPCEGNDTSDMCDAFSEVCSWDPGEPESCSMKSLQDVDIYASPDLIEGVYFSGDDLSSSSTYYSVRYVEEEDAFNFIQYDINGFHLDAWSLYLDNSYGHPDWLYRLDRSASTSDYLYFVNQEPEEGGDDDVYVRLIMQPNLIQQECDEIRGRMLTVDTYTRCFVPASSEDSCHLPSCESYRNRLGIDSLNVSPSNVCHYSPERSASCMPTYT